MPVDDAEAEAAATVMSLLLADATEREYRPIVAAALRAGLLWKCRACAQPVYTNRETCCGQTRTEQ
ncbi:hypothetical protein [Embleya sp. NPDC001921]